LAIGDAVTPELSHMRLLEASEPSPSSPSPVAKQWERVAEGRVRALCFSKECSSRSENTARKSPHPRFAHLLPLLRNGRRGVMEEPYKNPYAIAPGLTPSVSVLPSRPRAM